MGVTFFKRYRMEFDLREGHIALREPPPGFQLLRWSPRLLEAHAEAKFRSFRNELDANVFPCLGDADGCQRLMNEITRRQGFVSEATWLLRYTDPGTTRPENCGTVQGIRENEHLGSIQNVGIVSGRRGNGLGSLIVSHALDGFRRVGLKVVTLEVTAQNTGAIRLYQRLGFRIQKTVFKSVEVPDVL